MPIYISRAGEIIGAKRRAVNGMKQARKSQSRHSLVVILDIRYVLKSARYFKLRQLLEALRCSDDLYGVVFRFLQNTRI